MADIIARSMAAAAQGGGGSGAVQSVNGKTGAVVLTNADVGALPVSTVIPSKTSELENDSDFITSSDIPTIPTKVSELENDEGFITEEDIPTVPTKVSELQNDEGFITDAALENYYTEDEVDEKLEDKQHTLTAGDNITIENNVISATGGGGGGEPAAYLKSATVEGDTLILTDKDDSTVTFTDTGNEVSVSSTGTATDEVQYITIDGVEKKLPSGGGGSSYTFTNGLTESDGTVSWDLNDRIKAGSKSEAVIIGSQASTGDYYHNEVSKTGAVAIGGGCKANGKYSIAAGLGLTKSNTAGIITEGDGSFAHGYADDTTSFIKASGDGATAIGICKQKGESITASGEGSFAGGYPNREQIQASGKASFAFGRNGNKATGTGSVAMGDGNEASGTGSSAFGCGTKAQSVAQIAIGKYNAIDNTSAFIIGNGTDNSSRSNALAVDWNGDIYIANAKQPRHSLNATETTPTVEGSICWTYE